MRASSARRTGDGSSCERRGTHRQRGRRDPGSSTSELTSITSITSFTTSHIASSRRSKGPFVHVVHAEMAASHKATSGSRGRLTSDESFVALCEVGVVRPCRCWGLTWWTCLRLSSLRASTGRADDVRNKRMKWLSEIPLPRLGMMVARAAEPSRSGLRARASRAADAAPLTARRSRAVRCRSRGRGACRQSDQGTRGHGLGASARRAEGDAARARRRAMCRGTRVSGGGDEHGDPHLGGAAALGLAGFAA